MGEMMRMRMVMEQVRKRGIYQGQHGTVAWERDGMVAWKRDTDGVILMLSRSSLATYDTPVAPNYGQYYNSQ